MVSLNSFIGITLILAASLPELYTHALLACTAITSLDYFYIRLLYIVITCTAITSLVYYSGYLNCRCLGYVGRP